MEVQTEIISGSHVHEGRVKSHLDEGVECAVFERQLSQGTKAFIDDMVSEYKEEIEWTLWNIRWQRKISSMILPVFAGILIFAIIPGFASFFMLLCSVVFAILSPFEVFSPILQKRRGTLLLGALIICVLLYAIEVGTRSGESERRGLAERGTFKALERGGFTRGFGGGEGWKKRSVEFPSKEVTDFGAQYDKDARSKKKLLSGIEEAGS